MTHFIGAVVVPAYIDASISSREVVSFGSKYIDVTPSQELDEFLNKALAKFDENKRIERWIPREELIAKERAAIEDYRDGIYAEYLKDPVA